MVECFGKLPSEEDSDEWRDSWEGFGLMEARAAEVLSRARAAMLVDSRL